MPDRFATMFTCIDGRIQRPLDEWARNHLDVEYLDTITEPGPEAVLATTGERCLDVLLEKVQISQRAHGSATLVIAGHADCAGNPVSTDEHRNQLRQSLARLAGRLPDTRIIAVHADRCGEQCWDPEIVAEVSPPSTDARPAA
ncbi:carbonic anhydrase [Micromonospora thermarum]|uniref:carbonic anhydrase n=1 Tax=Micromonospora thermarum TaxID=2720024 RepID=UPI001F0E41A9|nr:carbonic anhydrase [Micromonospora thermarum]